MRKHAIIQNIHLWLGLVSGLIVSVTGLSGSLYLWQPELSALFNPELLTIRAHEPVSEEVIHRTAFGLYRKNGDSLRHIGLPYREQQSISLTYNNGTTAFFHPVTGAFLGTKSPSMQFFEGLLRFHRTLLIPGFGRYIVGGNTLIFVVFILTSGFWLWWKRYGGRIRKGLTLKSRLRKMAFNYDLHKLLGIYFLVPLMILGISGCYFTLIHLAKPALPPAEKNHTAARDYSPAEKTHPTVAEWIGTPLNNGYQLRAVYLPQSPTGHFRFRYIGARTMGPGLRKTREVEISRTNEIHSISAFHEKSASGKIGDQMYPVHTGEIMGLTGRILVFVTGFIPLILWITGFRLYWFRKQVQKKSTALKRRAPSAQVMN